MTAKAIGAVEISLLLILILFWGSSFVVVKTALAEGLSPIETATFRFLLAGVFFVIAIGLRRIRNKNFKLSVGRKDALTVLFLALTGVTFFFTAQYIAISMAGASIPAIFVCLLSPILITTFSAKIFKEHLSRRQLAGISIAAIGTFAVTASGALRISGNNGLLLGSLIALLTPFLWAVYSLAGKKMIEKYDAFLIVAYVNILGGLCLIPLSLFENSFNRISAVSANGWLAILFLSITCSFLGYYVWFYVLKRVGATVTSSFLFAEPLITVLFAVAFVGENISIFVIGGGLLIFLGVFLVAKK